MYAGRLPLAMADGRLPLLMAEGHLPLLMAEGHMPLMITEGCLPLAMAAPKDSRENMSKEGIYKLLCTLFFVCFRGAGGCLTKSNLYNLDNLFGSVY